MRWVRMGLMERRRLGMAYEGSELEIFGSFNVGEIWVGGGRGVLRWEGTRDTDLVDGCESGKEGVCVERCEFE